MKTVKIMHLKNLALYGIIYCQLESDEGLPQMTFMK